MSSAGSFVHDPPLHCVSRSLLVCYNCTCLLLFTNSAMCVTTSPPPTCICFSFSSLCCNEECFPLTFILYSYYYILLLTLCTQCTVIMLCITVTDERVTGNFGGRVEVRVLPFHDAFPYRFFCSLQVMLETYYN